MQEVRQVVHLLGGAGRALRQAPREAPWRGHVGGRRATGGGLTGGLARVRGRPGTRFVEDEGGKDGRGVPAGGGGGPGAGQGKEAREAEGGAGGAGIIFKLFEKRFCPR